MMICPHPCQPVDVTDVVQVKDVVVALVVVVVVALVVVDNQKCFFLTLVRIM